MSKPDPKGSTKSIARQIYEVASSLEVAITLFIVLAILTAIGTLIIQGQEPAFYYQYYGPRLGGLILSLGFDDLFHGALYQFLIGLLVLNLLLCTFARPFNLYYLGFYVIHLSIIVIIAGAVYGAVVGDRGMFEIRKGETVEVYTSRKDKGVQPLPCKLTLERFEVAFKEPEPRLLWVDDTGQIKAAAVLKAQEQVLFQGNLPFAPPKGKVVKLEWRQTAGGKGETEPVYEGLAVIEFVGVGKVEFTYPQDANKSIGGHKYVFTIAPIIGAYRSHLLIDCNGAKQKYTLSVNHPLELAGYRFYQSTYRADESGKYTISGIEVVHDPGIPIVFAGFWALVAGVFWHFYVRPYFVRRRKQKENG